MILVILVLALLPPVLRRDPAPGLTTSPEASRNLECQRMSVEQLQQRSPGRLADVKPRGDYVERSALVCTERVLRLGLRAPGDEAVLASLDSTVGELVAVAGDLHPELAGRTWLVEVHHPNPQVAGKVSFAAKNALGARGVAVSDRVPVLSAGDIDVLTRLAPSAAYEGACRRYADNGSLRAGDTLLALVQRDPRETLLHAGLCTGGTWAWVQ